MVLFITASRLLDSSQGFFGAPRFCSLPGAGTCRKAPGGTSDQLEVSNTLSAGRRAILEG